MDRTVMLAFPHGEHHPAEFTLSLLAACRGDTPVAGIADFKTGPFMAKARNNLAAMFLASTAEWLFTVDADMVFTAGTIPALLAWAHPDERPIVAARCHTLMNDGDYVTVAYQASKDNQGRFCFATLHDQAHLPADDLIRIDATGSAAMLIHRSVFGKITANEGAPGLWYAEQVIDGQVFSEDLSFCLRATAAGIPLFLATGVQVGHMKLVQLGQVTP